MIIDDEIVQVFPDALDINGVGEFVFCGDCETFQLIESNADFCKVCNSENLLAVDDPKQKNGYYFEEISFTDFIKEGLNYEIVR